MSCASIKHFPEGEGATMSDGQATPLGRLAQEPLQYATARFVLRNDLERLIGVRRADAPEAVILYCARILEALSADAIGHLGLEPSANVFSNLELLEYLNRLDTAARYWAHALRRLGNQIRHIQRCISREEADLAVQFAERWLEWYFCRFSHGLRLTSLTQNQAPLGLSLREEEDRLLRLVEELETQPGRAGAELLDAPAFLQTPILPAAAAEVLLGQKRGPEALRLLEAALERFPDDVRLRQLMGLHWRRAGALDRALAYLLPLCADSARDEETAGIVAAIRKQQWLDSRDNHVLLADAHRGYGEAWNASGKRNTWLGINAAATALFLGKVTLTRRLAAEVRSTLRDRAARLPSTLRGTEFAFNYWDEVTLAESHLVIGERTAAERLYSEAFARHAGRTGDIETTLRQKAQIESALDAIPRS
jgi:hypothetical protein